MRSLFSRRRDRGEELNLERLPKLGSSLEQEHDAALQAPALSGVSVEDVSVTQLRAHPIPRQLQEEAEAEGGDYVSPLEGLDAALQQRLAEVAASVFAGADDDEAVVAADAATAAMVVNEDESTDTVESTAARAAAASADAVPVTDAPEELEQAPAMMVAESETALAAGTKMNAAEAMADAMDAAAQDAAQDATAGAAEESAVDASAEAMQDAAEAADGNVAASKEETGTTLHVVGESLSFPTSGEPALVALNAQEAAALTKDNNRVVVANLYEGEARERYERHSRLQAQRYEAQTADLVAMSSPNNGPRPPQFSLLSSDVELMALPQPKAPTLLDAEDEKGLIEAEDFITGNVSVVSEQLRTGTDNVAVGSGAAAADDTEQPHFDPNMVATLPYLPGKECFRSTVTMSAAGNRERKPRLLPLICQDFLAHWLVYGLAVLACVLCLMKVYQVQETRDLTSQLNDITLNNANLEKEWLNLMATRQSLTEHAKIRAYASNKLQMQSPKTNSEQVISLHHQ
ncbi:MAG: cell division protein FtsL [Candidatus Anaerobiospirillum pullicola]|uniref:Cell division protein FtsL n=1 Tax=Candidatus Anaerobiospirillum pullicola TaxID=2838451 RepID=A0A948TEC1_9GAMM|nr:cell division protein FtsL [Candidatus Anaerobiospirillum pullicola]